MPATTRSSISSTSIDCLPIRAFLAERFPDHLLAIRSVDDWSAPALAAAARDDGWAMVPSRQIWVVDDLARDWRARSAYSAAKPGYSAWLLPSGERYQLLQPELQTMCFMRP